MYSLDTIETNLVEHLVEHGFDVWLLDHRLSIELPASRLPSTLDDVAMKDYPTAVAAVLERRPDAVVVHGGLRRDDEGTTWGTRTVHTHGTGAATAVAAVNVLLGEESK